MTKLITSFNWKKCTSFTIGGRKGVVWLFYLSHRLTLTWGLTFKGYRLYVLMALDESNMTMRTFSYNNIVKKYLKRFHQYGYFDIDWHLEPLLLILA